ILNVQFEAEASSKPLQSCLSSSYSRLQTESSLEEVRRLREEVKVEAGWFCSNTEDVTWSFVQECLLLLLALTRHLSEELERFQQTPPPPAARRRTPELAPPLPPDVLSVAQQKTLAAALQFVVSLGVCPYLAPGVGVPLGRRSTFGALVEKLVRGGAEPAGGRRLLTTTNVLLQLAELSTLATLVFTRHLGDVMAALCQLGYQPHREEQRPLTAEECRLCKEALRNLLGKVYQPIIIKELLILQGGPKQVEITAGLGSAPAWLRRLCGQLLSERLMQPNGVQAVVRAVLEGGTGGDSDWRKCDAVARILVACPQQSTSADAYFRNICPQILELLHFKDKLTAQQFQRVATRAALSMVQERSSFAQQFLLRPLLAALQRCTTASNQEDSQVAVEESELTRCVEDVYKVWVVGNSPSVSLLEALEEVLPVVFTLFCFTKKNVSHLRDEDDELYEKLSGEQWRLECLMQILSELKDSDLPGDFFLELLQVKTQKFLCDQNFHFLHSSATTTDPLPTIIHELNQLMRLNVFRAKLSSLTHLSSVYRACVGLDQASGPRVGNPVESQTLSMGMGLVATMLSGPQVSADDYSSMSKLLPALQTLSQQHPDVFIQELASNLRGVIATHGAYRPENLNTAAGSSSRNPESTANHINGAKTPVSKLPASSAGSTRGSTSDPPNKPLSDWLLEACDPDVPTRAFALRVLNQKVHHRDPEAVQNQEKVLMLFLENLEHEDSFVYLSAIQGLAALADSYPDRILERLLKDFQAGPSLPSSDRQRCLETRLKLGEVLMRASRAMGDLAPHLGRPLLGVFLQGTRDPDQTVRASSLSNLGELCQRMDYSLGPLAQELSSCLTALIKTEKEAEVRRAAVHVIAQLLRGLSDKTTQVLSEVLLDLYRALKLVVRSDPDEVAVLHAQLALEELDDVMRRFIFPQQKLEKKIVVLP
uniref:Transport and golgi organization 6 homolog (Drosophila) n=1 Tax=Amphiprion ocellaris TaxID=80972 RepID=A0AAQ6ACM5_AMPOC